MSLIRRPRFGGYEIAIVISGQAKAKNLNSQQSRNLFPTVLPDAKCLQNDT